MSSNVRGRSPRLFPLRVRPRSYRSNNWLLSQVAEVSNDQRIPVLVRVPWWDLFLSPCQFKAKSKHDTGDTPLFPSYLLNVSAKSFFSKILASHLALSHSLPDTCPPGPRRIRLSSVLSMLRTGSPLQKDVFCFLDAAVPPSIERRWRRAKSIRDLGGAKILGYIRLE